MNKYFIKNGELYGAIDEHQISINDDAFNYGYGIFETVLIKKGEPIFFEDHFNRIKQDASQINLNFDYAYEDVYKWVKTLIDSCNCQSCEKIGLKIILYKAHGMTDIVVKMREYSYVEEDYKKGYTLGVSEYRRHSTNPIYRMKSMNYMNNMMCKRSLVGLDELVFLNEKNYVTECIFSNIFIVKGHTIHTPMIDDGLLPGITRKKVIDISKEIGYYVLESHITLDDVEDADEVFISNSLLEIMPVNGINNRVYNIKNYEIMNRIKTALENRV